MTYKKGDYFGATCRSLDLKYIGFDLDTSGRWKRPGFCLGMSTGPEREHHSDAVEGGIYHTRDWPFRFCLDIKAPQGEPNRLYLTLGPLFITFGLISWHKQIETGTEERVFRGQTRTVHLMKTVRCRPYNDGLDRYKYHKDESGRWVRDDKPARWHWGWLTIERRKEKPSDGG